MNKYTVWIQMDDEWKALVHYDAMSDGFEAIRTARSEFRSKFAEWFGQGYEDTVNLDYEEDFVGTPLLVTSTLSHIKGVTL